MSHYETRQVKVYDREDYDKASEGLSYANAYSILRSAKEKEVKYDGTEEDYYAHCFNVVMRLAMDALYKMYIGDKK